MFNHLLFYYILGAPKKFRLYELQHHLLKSKNHQSPTEMILLALLARLIAAKSAIE